MDIIILHRNLRLEDNSALFHGSHKQNYRVIYVYDKHYWSSDGRSPRQFSFFIDCLKELQIGLTKLNSYIEIFQGSYSDLTTYIETNYPQSRIHLNHSTDTSYFRNQMRNLILVTPPSSNHTEMHQTMMEITDLYLSGGGWCLWGLISSHQPPRQTI